MGGTGESEQEDTCVAPPLSTTHNSEFAHCDPLLVLYSCDVRPRTPQNGGLLVAGWVEREGAGVKVGSVARLKTEIRSGRAERERSDCERVPPPPAAVSQRAQAASPSPSSTQSEASGGAP